MKKKRCHLRPTRKKRNPGEDQRKEKAPNKERYFEGSYKILIMDYFSGLQSKYNETDFASTQTRSDPAHFELVGTSFLFYGVTCLYCDTFD
jgi:hypothetical protein